MLIAWQTNTSKTIKQPNAYKNIISVPGGRHKRKYRAICINRLCDVVHTCLESIFVHDIVTLDIDESSVLSSCQFWYAIFLFMKYFLSTGDPEKI